MSKDTVWVSRAMMDSTLMKGFDHDNYFVDKENALDAMRRNEKGEPLPADRFPKEMYGEYRDEKVKKQPDIFNAGGFWTVSAECADVLRQFDLGQTSLYPVKILQHDRTTPVEGTYFCLNFGETKDAFVSEESPRARERGYNAWGLPYGVKDGEMAIKPDALKGVDLWMDQRVKDAFFLSDPLVKALKAAKLTRRFGLRKCRIL
ncbi:imm11 family protein [Parasulfitobacter algicola]|uniref:Immunity MXAN-0049 protein domain-containing protein n=1 Tax=Parasulfitobacter algicola TaxID=2614809 RepID=A0ABX2ISD5_9RHOB|nr:DUF1629 domain-containing protein [Sulfitobacter algicola]NSX55455.1 hypothetical protein [Sulfitobacter algicola]